MNKTYFLKNCDVETAETLCQQYLTTIDKEETSVVSEFYVIEPDGDIVFKMNYSDEDMNISLLVTFTCEFIRIESDDFYSTLDFMQFLAQNVEEDEDLAQYFVQAL